jgi:hypothetical protein
VIPLDDPAVAELRAFLDELTADIAAGRVVALALVAASADGDLAVNWGALPCAGPHAGSVLRGAVAYLGARMDAAALER